jgi:speckle-type POZ protein
MATVTSDIAKMIVQYEWILENIEEEPKTIASKMILFRGERVFRVGLKNLRNCHQLPNKISNSPVVFFMAIDLNKIGMRVEGVTYGIQDSENAPSTMSQLNQEKIGDNANLQLFKTSITKQVTGNCKFVFRICIAGSVSGFCYRLSDRLAKDQLWAAAKSKNSVDVEFVVKGKTVFSAHKAILAARSKVLEAEFTKEQPVVAEGPHQIHIDDVELSTVEQFLYFIYTGESIRTFANEELLKLADQYQLKTLSSLCGVALKKIENTQMVSLANNLNEEAEIPSSIIR